MQKHKLLDPIRLGDLELKNRVVMAPMTRARAANPELVPNDLMAEYYSQRASAGLQITEGTWVNRDGIGFINVPGLFSDAQTQGWKKIVEAVHKKGGKIFSQLGHLGPIAGPEFTGGEAPLGPSAINANFQYFSPTGPKPTVTPRAMTLDDIKRTVADYRTAGTNAKKAGFDGVEVHGAMLYLIPSFLNPITNKRTDNYGGSPENRSRFVLEILQGLVDVWGAGRVSLKLSPSLVMGAFVPNNGIIETYEHLFNRLNDLPLAYAHVINGPGSFDGTPFEKIKDPVGYFRRLYRGILIAGGGYNQASAEKLLESNGADLVAFGKHFIANPDLVERFKLGVALSDPDQATFYQGGPEGYTTYKSATDSSFAQRR